jgi:4-carboxymuconolactone decarboxylase
MALYRTNELPGHVKRALDNGVTREELVELPPTSPFMAAGPVANSAVAILRQAFADAGAS